MSGFDNILHMITPLKHMSPFDINMAVDAGYRIIATHVNTSLAEVAGLVQDAMFSRPPDAGARTAVFVGGDSVALALSMFDAAKAALVPPFKVSIFTDPAGSFTTAAAVTARVEKTMKSKFDRQLAGNRIAIFGATGVVGFACAVLMAREGADVVLVAREGAQRAEEAARLMEERFGARVRIAEGSNNAQKTALLQGVEIVIAAAAAGKRVLGRESLAGAPSVRLVVDVNAVPPSGVEGIEPMAKETPIEGTQAIALGALTVGNVKYRTQAKMLQQMAQSTKPMALDFTDAFATARSILA